MYVNCVSALHLRTNRHLICNRTLLQTDHQDFKPRFKPVISPSALLLAKTSSLQAVPNQGLHSSTSSAARDAGHLNAPVKPSVTLVTANGSQVDVPVHPGTTILAAAEHAGVRLPASCRQGSCTSCCAKVLQGRVQHSPKPECLTPALLQAGYTALCCAHVPAGSHVVIQTHQGARVREERQKDEHRMKHRHG